MPTRLRESNGLKSGEESSTEAIAARLAQQCHPGRVIGLVGELGAGKTVFVRGAVSGLGGDPGRVRSPTFTLMNTYACSRTIYHFDLYRLHEESEIDGIGFYEFARDDGLTFVEWADRFQGIENEIDIWVTIEFGVEPDDRLITISGDDWR